MIGKLVDQKRKRPFGLHILFFVCAWLFLYVGMAKLFLFPVQAQKQENGYWPTPSEASMHFMATAPVAVAFLSESDFIETISPAQTIPVAMGMSSTVNASFAEQFVAGARLEVATKPSYVNAYYEGGYPPEGEAVCTDLIWRALAYAHINLKELIDADIAENPQRYAHITKADPNIDFRRVRNLKIYFDFHAQSLTTDLTQTQEWQAGDIVVFSEADQEYSHIGILSDQRNAKDIPFLLHHSGLAGGGGEEDILAPNQKWATIVAHYRIME